MQIETSQARHRPRNNGAVVLCIWSPKRNHTEGTEQNRDRATKKISGRFLHRNTSENTVGLRQNGSVRRRGRTKIRNRKIHNLQHRILVQSTQWWQNQNLLRATKCWTRRHKETGREIPSPASNLVNRNTGRQQ
jgi:hypothetical protein